MKLLKELLADIGINDVQVPELAIEGPAKLSEAQSKHISFLANPKYENEVYTSNAGAILVAKDFSPKSTIKACIIPVDDPYECISRVLALYSNNISISGQHESAVVADDAKIGKESYIGPMTFVSKHSTIGDFSKIGSHVFIGKNVQIGAYCDIHSGVKIYDNSVIGNHCIIHANTVIGADGFGFVPQEDGSFKKVPQAGNVLIKNNVEIGSNCSIDRATMGSTLVGEGVKLDNLIQVGHNAEIGDHTVIAAQTGVSGSTKIGHHGMIGGQVGFVGHISIAPYAKINAKSGISKSIKEEGAKLNGIPAFSFTDSLRSQSVYRKLPQLQKKLQEIEEILSLLRK